MKIAIHALRFVNMLSIALESADGKSAYITCGIVSPTIMQKAIMPPKALKGIIRGST